MLNTHTKIQYTLCKTVVLILMLLVPTGAVEIQEAGIISAEEAQNIVLSHPEIISWLENNEFVEFDALIHDYIEGYWEIQIITIDSNKDETKIRAVVDDLTGAIMSISYLKNDGISENQKEDDALDYFLKQEISSQFTNNNFKFHTQYLSANRYLITGVNGSGISKFSFEAYIGMNIKIDGNINFHIIKIRGDFEFPNFQHTFDEVASQLGNNSIVKHFIDENPGHSYKIFSTIYFESAYHSYSNSTGFEIELINPQYFQFRYEDGNYTRAKQGTLSSIISFVQIPFATIYLDLTDSGEIRNLEGFYYSEAQVISILELVISNSIITSWINDVGYFVGFLNYIEAEIYELSIYGLVSPDYGKFYINVTSMELGVYEITHSIKATLLALDVIDIAYSTIEASLFLENNFANNHTAIYNSNGTWLITIYNPLIDGNKLVFHINDSTGEINEIEESYFASSPNLTKDDILDIISYMNIINQITEYPDSKVVFYMDSFRDWVGYIYSTTFPQNNLLFRIADDTGKVLSEVESIRGRRNDTSFESVNEVLNQITEVKEYRESYPNAYESLYFTDNWYFHSETLISPFVLYQIRIGFEADNMLNYIENQTQILQSQFLPLPEHVAIEIEFSNSYEEIVMIRNSKLKVIFSDSNLYYRLGKLKSFDISYFNQFFSEDETSRNDADINNTPLIIVIGLFLLTIISVVSFKMRKSIDDSG